MEFDLMLSDRCSEDEFYFRLYRWKPYCISLGANQGYDVIDYTMTERDDIDVVKRPTGGRAILHSEEITYSVCLVLRKDSTPHTVYREINNALQKGLEIYDPLLAAAKLESRQPDFGAIYKSGGGVACFSTAARNELKVSNKKIVGSAQRKSGRKILQHGSILCGSYHKKITDYLLLSNEEKSRIKNELDTSTTDISGVTGGIDYTRLTRALLAGMEEYYHHEFIHTPQNELIPAKTQEQILI